MRPGPTSRTVAGPPEGTQRIMSDRHEGGCGDQGGGAVTVARLVGTAAPPATLRSTSGNLVNVAMVEAEWTVIYVYPRTGVPGTDPPVGWGSIPGALGCTAQSCAYRDAHDELLDVGAAVFGLSTQQHQDQVEFATREHLPFDLLSDPELRIGRPLRLPTFSVDDATFYRRLTLVIRGGTIQHVRFPVAAPEEDAQLTLRWIRAHTT